MIYDSIIIGSGPAGLTAAIYNARADLKVLCIEGTTPGGQLMLTTEIENYPGYPEGISGPELMQNFRKQAKKFGTEYITKDVTSVDFSKHIKKIMVEDESYETKTVIIATGATAKWLGVPGEKKLTSKGISACATCDGFFFRDKEIIVIGGGDTAMEEANFLTKFAKKVTVVHRREELRASKIMQQRAFDNQKIKFLWNSQVEKFNGNDQLTSVTIKNVKTGETTEMSIEGAFLAIGHTPATKLFIDQIELSDKGFAIRSHNSMTSAPGVFVSGDVFDHRYMQAITAAGMGCEAAIDAERWIEENSTLFSKA